MATIYEIRYLHLAFSDLSAERGYRVLKIHTGHSGDVLIPETDVRELHAALTAMIARWDGRE